MIFCIDSDGCVFDNMQAKHEQAFLPAFIEVLGLEEWRPLVLKHWYAINLYSRTRGVNRFVAFGSCISSLNAENDPALKSCLPEGLPAYERFITNPANRKAEAIRSQIDLTETPAIFHLALRWSDRVNALVATVETPHEPFPHAAPTLRKMATLGEVHVVSQAPHATLETEWKQAGLADVVTRILGQEFGSKSEQVHVAREGRNVPSLLVGDAPGDELAATAAECGFFPIIPGEENRSWQRLGDLIHTGSPAFQKVLEEESRRFHSVLLANDR